MACRSLARAVVFAALAFSLACRREDARLDEVQKMAYSVKPAVVRVSAFATAEFRYSGEVMQAAQEAMGVSARGIPATASSVETGAGGSGSGFIINSDGFILTNGHVVAPTRDTTLLEAELRRNGAISALVKHFPIDDLHALYRDEELERYIEAVAAAGRLEKMKIVNEVELSNGEKLDFQVQKYEPSLSQRGNDLALLSVQRRGLPILRLGDSEAVGVGESIWSVGYPAVASSNDDVIGGWLSRESDLEATFNPGTITAIKTNIVKSPVFQSNVAIYRGNSGGPAVNRAGAVIGISTWGHTNAEQIKFLVPINAAKTLLLSAGVATNVDGEFNRYYGAALEAAADGKWEGVKKNLASAERLFPKSPDVIRFRHDADRVLATIPAWRRHPVATAFGGGAALIALFGTVALVAGSRRPRIPPELLTATTVESVVAPDGRKSSQAMLGKFTILNGDRAGQKVGLGGSGIRIGRESAICEIVLEDPKVSRLHAEVVSIDGKVMLIDRNSSNGTYVNDQKIDRRFLKDGDIIHFGGRNAVAVAFHA